MISDPEEVAGRRRSFAEPLSRRDFMQSLCEECWDIVGIRNNVVKFCNPSPSLHFNQIAVADRRFNTSWRRRTHALCQGMLRAAIFGLLNGRHADSGNHVLTLLDLEDVFNTELATAAKAVELRNWERFGRTHVGRWQDSFAGYVPRTPLRVGWRDYGVPHTEPAGPDGGIVTRHAGSRRRETDGRASESTDFLVSDSSDGYGP